MSDERNEVSDYVSHDVDQTKQSIKDKWESSSHFQIGGLDAFDSDTLSWIHTRNGFSSVTDFIKHVSQYQNILDAGCGNGRVLALLDDLLKDEHTLIQLIQLKDNLKDMYEKDKNNKTILPLISDVETQIKEYNKKHDKKQKKHKKNYNEYLI